MGLLPSRRQSRSTMAGGDPTMVMFFDSALGSIGLAYTDSAVVAVQLPEATIEASRRGLADKVGQMVEIDPDQASPMALDAASKIQALVAGQPVDLRSIPIDVGSASDFNKRVYDQVRLIGRGETLTYGEVAGLVGEPGAAQAVGRAMGANPVPVIVPCHRVVGSDGKLVGFSAGGGLETKRRMLLAEGCPLAPPSLFDEFG